MPRPPELVSTSQVAEQLGVHVRTVHRLAESGRLRPAGKVPGRTGAYLFAPDTVDAYLAAHRAGELADGQIPLVTVTRRGRLRT